LSAREAGTLVTLLRRVADSLADTSPAMAAASTENGI
jgi:hypothetical protein